jgi:hypothetical protein
MTRVRGFVRWSRQLVGIVVLQIPVVASAHPVFVTYNEVGDQCADHASLILTDEVGLGMPIGPFETMESIAYTIDGATEGDCGIGVGGGDDFRVLATNTTTHCLVDVFVAADSGTTFDNWDGTIIGFPAKRITNFWDDGAVVTFELLNVAPAAAPDFASLGVGISPAPSNFSIVANRDSDCDGVPDALEIPALTPWGSVLLVLLLAGIAGRGGLPRRRVHALRR